jgi:molybdenum-dependent DNA-binding transcriptional regulator ModE
LKALAAHIAAKHGVSGEDYKKRYGVDFLCNDRMRTVLSQLKTRGSRPTAFVPRTKAEIIVDLKAMNARRPFKNVSDLRSRDPGLWSLIVNHFGKAATLFRKLGFRTARHKTWSHEKVLAALRKWNSPRVPPGNALHIAAFKYFGSWKRAVKAAGIHYDIVRTTRKQAECRARRWARRHGALSYSKLNATNIKLRRLLHNKFGGIEAAARTLGLPYEPAYAKWTPQRVLDGIRERVRQGKRVRAMVMFREEGTLYKWGIRFFKSWDRALRACGLDPQEHTYARELALRAQAPRRGPGSRRT